jgi:hypothetical protein
VKLPSLGSGKSPFSGRSSGALKPPRFLSDLWADLRDRRLLPLVALLIVAIAATPFLLGSHDKEEPTEAPVVSVPSSAHAGFAVVPANNALRDYRKRLGFREPRNPFGQPAREQSGSSTGSGEPEATQAPVEASGEPQITETHVTNKAEVTVKAELTGVGINAKLGYLPHLKDQEKIRPMTKLPNAKHPVVVYVGPTQDDKGALFLMSSNVTAYYGKGRCAIAGQVCSLIELKPGHSATFAYGYGESRYKLQLKKLVALVHKVEVKKHFSSDSE